MRSSWFFRLFPPPKLLLSPQVGIDASDDAIRIVGYRQSQGRLEVALTDTLEFPFSSTSAGDIADEAEFIRLLSERARAHRISHARVSIPEEKSYLFQTVVPDEDARSVAQNIEFKIEANVPLSAADAAFDFDLLEGNPERASVSVVPLAYIQKQVDLYAAAGVVVTGFETVPHAVARAVIPAGSAGTRLIIHTMKSKTGMYIASGSTVVFASTVPWSADSPAADLAKEVERVYSYWSSLESSHGEWVKEVLVVGAGAPAIEEGLRASLGGSTPMAVPHVWGNALDMRGYIPPISKAESLPYVAAAGLAL